jgi:hypothetical protein
VAGQLAFRRWTKGMAERTVKNRRCHQRTGVCQKFLASLRFWWG